ncbi:hypothetical protein BKA82DRAFT_167074 [Pisolithus tinctorius]|uniref:Secreted protein n=1 Tax=Pisolithus tinctorius Marx 270 TaxID=870435 RepID=A0A0C3ID55_PISTI|nr:hypothetical protein BKA82DRAFT_167074 [Pisolithus tinctorius]KIN94972.1 hypothetical protein M404DRAFT_167074 [Pisolithus tinctorius Marx 270]
MGSHLHRLFVIILVHGAPVHPNHLREASRDHLCDDLHHQLIHHLAIPQPTQEQVYDYGLYLIGQALHRH